MGYLKTRSTASLFSLRGRADEPPAHQGRDRERAWERKGFAPLIRPGVGAQSAEARALSSTQGPCPRRSASSSRCDSRLGDLGLRAHRCRRAGPRAPRCGLELGIRVVAAWWALDKLLDPRLQLFSTESSDIGSLRSCDRSREAHPEARGEATPQPRPARRDLVLGQRPLGVAVDAVAGRPHPIRKAASRR